MKRAILISLLALLLAPAARASVEEARARITPWSGDWWSMRRGRMCNGYRDDDMSPFRKHDRVTGAHANDWVDATGTYTTRTDADPVNAATIPYLTVTAWRPIAAPARQYE